MIKVSVEILPEAFLKVFNNILTSGGFQNHGLKAL
jgi:hypothetical protein